MGKEASLTDVEQICMVPVILLHFSSHCYSQAGYRYSVDFGARGCLRYDLLNGTAKKRRFPFAAKQLHIGGTAFAERLQMGGNGKLS